MAIGKITGSVVADNTLTESNLAFGISGQSSATSWSTDTLKVNIIESDDSTAIQLNDALNVSGALTVNNDLYLPDGKKLYLGDSNDLQIYHDGSQSIIEDVGTGQLKILAENTMFFGSATGSQFYFRALKNGAFEAYHSNSKKFETTSTGAEVTGELKVDSIISNDSSALTLNSPIIAGSSFKFDGDAQAITTVLDEDNMASDSATALATQQSIKAYVDSVAGGTITLGDSASNSGAVDINGSQDLEFRSGDSITATVAGNGVTFDLNEIISVDTITAGDSSVITVGSTTAFEGSVGIGTTSPQDALHISSTSPEIRLEDSATSTYAVISSDSALGSLFLRADEGNSGSSSQIVFFVDSSQKGLIDSSGNLLVGTTQTVPGVGNTTAGISLRGTNGAFISRDTVSGNATFTVNKSTNDGIIQYFNKDGTAIGKIGTTSGSLTIGGGSSADDDITIADNGDVTFGSDVTIAGTLSINTITSSDSTAIQINDGLNVSGTVSADNIDVNTITSSDSTGININDTKLYVNGSTVLTVDTADEPTLTTSAADVDHVIINDGGVAKRIALGNINISSFNNDANYASAASTGFVNSTVTTVPISSDSTATDYGVGEPVGVGTATDTTDAFGVPLGTTFDSMEPRGTTQATDFGTEEAYVGA